MHIQIFKDYDEMSRAAAELVANFVNSKPNCVLGLPTGSTPLGMYRRLVELFSEGKVSFKGVKTFNLDEYYPMAKDHKNSFHYFMWDNFFGKIDILRENVHIPDGEAKDPVNECENYEKMIKEAGGIDLQVLGVGVNGHIGFNEPEDALYVSTHLTDLAENTIKVNSKFFAEGEKMPTQALSMGMTSILGARKILLLINGANKAEALKAAVSGRITTGWPISFLQLHNDVIIMTDEETASLAGIQK